MEVSDPFYSFRSGHRDPIWLNEISDSWFELYNAGAESVDLDGYYLADNYEHRAPLPFLSVIEPGEFKTFSFDSAPVSGQ